MYLFLYRRRSLTYAGLPAPHPASSTLTRLTLVTLRPSPTQLQVSGPAGSHAAGGYGASKQSELLTSIKRYYSNAFTDMVKQVRDMRSRDPARPSLSWVLVQAPTGPSIFNDLDRG
jgi:hypothetical protein